MKLQTKLFRNAKILFLRVRIRTLISKRENQNFSQKFSKKLLNNFYLEKEIITNFYKYISLLSLQPIELPLVAKWLIENKNFLISELHQLQEITDKKILDSLPKDPNFPKSNPIIIEKILDFLQKNKGWFSSTKFEDYLLNVQSERDLILDEIFSLQLLLKLIFVTEITKSVVHIFEYINANLDVRKKGIDSLDLKNNKEYIYYFLNFYGKKNFSDFAVSTVVVSDSKKIINGDKLGQNILNLKKLNETDWDKLFHSVSKVDRLLTNDPSNIYSKMSSESKKYYINQIKIISKKYSLSEVEFTEALLSLAQKGENDVTSHVGYYLVDEGIKDFEITFGKPLTGSIRNSKLNGFIYLFSLLFLSTLGLFIIYYFVAGNFFQKLLFITFSTIPVYLFAKKILLKFAANIDSDQKLPSLEIRKNLSTFQKTVFVVPAFVKNNKDIKRLLTCIETIYLANRGNNIYFSLALDFPDSHIEKHDYEEKLREDLKNAISNLNEKYNFTDKFSFFLRDRLWSPNQNLWMGWERKRGKILEFLRVLKKLPVNSKFVISLDDIPEFKYIVVVDEDSHVTKNLVLDLVSIIDHPLNRPFYSEEEDRIKRGYTIIRTQSGYLYSTKENSVFARLLCGANGYNHYSTTSSEIYFKLFGESLFTGKGVMDIDLFLRLTYERFPDDTLVSHDHIEGMICRVGFAGEGQIFEGFPTNIRSYLLRLHRWIRGDWQIIDWLFAKTKDRKGIERKNPLSFLDKQKIFDGLMNSLLIPCLFALTLLITLAEFENKVLLYLILLIEFFAWDYFSGFVELFWKLILKRKIKFFLIDFLSLNKFMLKDKFFEFLFLPYIAALQFNAIITALYRKFITNKNTLEWATFVSVEGHKFRFAYLKLFLPTWILLLAWFLVMYLYNKTDPIIFFMIWIWIISPFLVRIYDIRLKTSY